LGARLPTDDLDETMRTLAGLIPSDILPIAHTDGDDFVCLDLRKGMPAGTVYWDRVGFWGTNVWREADLCPIAEDFTAFLDGLHNFR
jgi:hypothetical protein